METIFIQIAAYRDSELVPTIEDCLRQACYPQHLRFGICWQHDEDDTSMHRYQQDPRFRILDVAWQDSKGVCWARHQVQQLYEGETYTLQLDSHHRFAANWDVGLIELIKQAGVPKPLITGYAPNYDRRTGQLANAAPRFMAARRFLKEGVLVFKPRNLLPQEMTKPLIAARFYSAHFSFAHGQFCTEVPHDPDLYFNGEEISIAVRAFTHGYDLFHPTSNIVWHEYERPRQARHWTDARRPMKIAMQNQRSFRRTRQLLKMEKTTMEFGDFGLGTARPLQEYERYAGVHFASRRVSIAAFDGTPPALDNLPSKSAWEASLVNQLRASIDLPKQEIPDFSLTAYVDLIIKDLRGGELYAERVSPQRWQALKSARRIHVVMDFFAAGTPVSCECRFYNAATELIDDTEYLLAEMDNERSFQNKIFQHNQAG